MEAGQPGKASCSCKVKPGSTEIVCPLQGKCLDKGVIYEATVVTEDNVTKKYIGAASTSFKDRWYNHRSSFLLESKKHQTSLSTYVWKKRDEGMNPVVSYRAMASAQPYTADRGRCDLCLREKVEILLAEESSSLNKRSEIACKCRHRYKHTLAGWDPSIT